MIYTDIKTRFSIHRTAQQWVFSNVLRSGFLLACLAGIGMPLPIQGQTPAPVRVSLTLVNALPGTENLHLLMSESELWPQGFTPGQSTGGAIIPGGKVSMEARCAGFASTKFKADFPSGSNCAMILYPGEEVIEGPDKGKKKIGVFLPPPILAGQALKGKSWHVLLAGPIPQAQVSINGKLLDLKMGEAVVAPSDRGGIVVEHAGKLLLASTPDEKGEYWAVVFGESTTSLQAVCLNHIVYSVPK